MRLELPSRQFRNWEEISPHAFFLLLEETVGRRLPLSDQRRFSECRCPQDFVTVIAESPVSELLEIKLWRLCQIYVALLSHGRLARPNQKGYDVFNAFELYGALKAGTVQVKHGGIGTSKEWTVKICSSDGTANYGVLVFIGTYKTRNPSKGEMIVIPREDLQPLIDEGKTRIHIHKTKYSRGSQHAKSGGLNQWWGYHLLDHTALKDRVSKYIHGVPIIDLEDLPLFAGLSGGISRHLNNISD